MEPTKEEEKKMNKQTTNKEEKVNKNKSTEEKIYREIVKYTKHNHKIKTQN